MYCSACTCRRVLANYERLDDIVCLRDGGGQFHNSIPIQTQSTTAHNLLYLSWPRPSQGILCVYVCIPVGTVTRRCLYCQSSGGIVRPAVVMQSNFVSVRRVPGQIRQARGRPIRLSFLSGARGFPKFSDPPALPEVSYKWGRGRFIYSVTTTAVFATELDTVLKGAAPGGLIIPLVRYVRLIVVKLAVERCPVPPRYSLDRYWHKKTVHGILREIFIVKRFSQDRPIAKIELPNTYLQPIFCVL